jgi:hypothetical protein
MDPRPRGRIGGPMQAPLTEHARIRMQQRGIPQAALDILLDFGREAHDHAVAAWCSSTSARVAT